MAAQQDWLNDTNHERQWMIKMSQFELSLPIPFNNSLCKSKSISKLDIFISVFLWEQQQQRRQYLTQLALEPAIKPQWRKSSSHIICIKRVDIWRLVIIINVSCYNTKKMGYYMFPPCALSHLDRSLNLSTLCQVIKISVRCEFFKHDNPAHRQHFCCPCCHWPLINAYL